jgi:hypothetical protein
MVGAILLAMLPSLALMPALLRALLVPRRVGGFDYLSVTESSLLGVLIHEQRSGTATLCSGTCTVDMQLPQLFMHAVGGGLYLSIPDSRMKLNGFEKVSF